MEEVPAASITEEGGAVEVEPEHETDAPVSGEVTSAVAEDAVEEVQSQQVEVPPAAIAAPEPEPLPQKAEESASSEPVANQSIAAPAEPPAGDRRVSGDHGAPPTSLPPAEPAEEDTPSVPPLQPATQSAAAGAGRHLASKDVYLVQYGDCLWRIAAALLPGDADAQAIASKVQRLWQLNEDRIRTGDPDLIYAGTMLRLR